MYPGVTMDPVIQPAEREPAPRSGTSAQDEQPMNTSIYLPAQSNQDARPPETTAEPTPPATTKQSMRTTIFPIFKSFRKLNNKLTTSNHHLEFLSTLKENGQVPRGLKIKTSTTTAELPPHLYQRWEIAHIELSNNLRDILIEYWHEICIRVRKQMEIVYDQLETNCTEDELNLVHKIIEESAIARQKELKERRSKKWSGNPSNRRDGTVGSGGGNPPPPPPPAAPLPQRA